MHLLPAIPRCLVRAAATAAVVAAAALSAFAGTDTAGQRTGDAARVLSGGVGEGARAQLQEQAGDYGLKLVFTLSTGHFISDVSFEVIGAGNLIVSDVAKGPWAFVRVPPGAYSVKATYDGLTQTRKVTVPKTGQRQLPFSWPAPARIQEQPK